MRVQCVVHCVAFCRCCLLPPLLWLADSSSRPALKLLSSRVSSQPEFRLCRQYESAVARASCYRCCCCCCFLLPLLLQVGVREVIQGWDLGILGTEVRRQPWCGARQPVPHG
jgi:hypothetical protein